MMAWAWRRTPRSQFAPAVRGVEILYLQTRHVGLSALCCSHHSPGNGTPRLCTTNPCGILRGPSTRTQEGETMGQELGGLGSKSV